jgi:hypothetical protein
VHFDRRATTSASNDKSAKATFGCDLSCRQASFVGIVAEAPAAGDTPRPCGARSTASIQQLLLPPGASRQHGQPSQGGVAVTDSPIAVQNACPNESSAQAIQLAGSPEHVAEEAEADEWCCMGSDTGNTELKVDAMVRRRRGIGAWYAGKFSSMDSIWVDGFAESTDGWVGTLRSKFAKLSDVCMSIVPSAASNAISLQKQPVSCPQTAAEKAQSASPLSWNGFRMRWKSAVSTRGEEGDGKSGSSLDGESKEADGKILSELSLEFGDRAMDGGEAYDTTNAAVCICFATLILFVG